MTQRDAVDPEALAEQAFVAVSYVLGQRGEALLEPLAEPTPAARRVAERLGHVDRDTRARVLAAEVARVVRALEARRLA
jgi:hypothetical protein